MHTIYPVSVSTSAANMVAALVGFMPAINKLSLQDATAAVMSWRALLLIGAILLPCINSQAMEIDDNSSQSTHLLKTVSDDIISSDDTISTDYKPLQQSNSKDETISTDYKPLQQSNSKDETISTDYKPLQQSNSEDETTKSRQSVRDDQQSLISVERLLPSLDGTTLNIRTLSTVEEPSPQDRQYIVEEILYFSRTLKLLDSAIMQKPLPIITTTESNAQESAAVTQGGRAQEKQTLERPGDIRYGCYLLLQAVRQPHRYHALFLAFNADITDNLLVLNDDNSAVLPLTMKQISFRGHSTVNQNQLNANQVPNITADPYAKVNAQLKALFQVPATINVNIQQALLTGTEPNKLLLAFEEQDNRFLGHARDILGRGIVRLQNDPVGVMQLLGGQAIRVGRVVATQGASELAS